jgi:hypothetical protein
MTLSTQKLVGVINLLSDPLLAANAAGILAREARERGLLVADLIAQTTAAAPAYSPPPPPSTAPSFRDVESVDDGGPYVKRIDHDHIGLVCWIIAEGPKAWCSQKPDGEEACEDDAVQDRNAQNAVAAPVPCMLAGASVWSAMDLER